MISSAHDPILFKFKNLNKNIPVSSCLQVYSCQSEDLNPKPIELNLVLCKKQLCHTFVPHCGTYFLCHTLYSICATLLTNVPHLSDHMFYFLPLSIVLFTFLKTLLCLCLYLSFIHFVVLKRTWI